MVVQVAQSLFDKLNSIGVIISDSDEETFELFSQGWPSGNLGMINEKASSVDVEVAGIQYEIRQSPGLLTSSRAEGTTGAALWKITPVVAEWLVDKSNALWSNGLLHSNATIVELGSGISGLIGIVLVQHVSIYVLTDLEYVMKVLQANVDVNRSAFSQHKKSKRQFLAKPMLIVLDWEDMNLRSLDTVISQDQIIDVVIACDCIYNEYLIEPFVNTCEIISQRHPTQKPLVLIAQQLRSDQVFSTFMSRLLAKFHVWRISRDILSREVQDGGPFVVHLAVLR